MLMAIVRNFVYQACCWEDCVCEHLKSKSAGGLELCLHASLTNSLRSVLLPCVGGNLVEEGRVVAFACHVIQVDCSASLC